MSNPNNYIPPVQSSNLAIVSLIAGIAGWTIVPLVGSVVAVITGHMAKKEIRESGGLLAGDGMATAGLILGYLSLGLTVLTICGFLAAIFLFGVTVSLPFCVLTPYNTGVLIAQWLY